MQPIGHRIQPSHCRSTGRDVIPGRPTLRGAERIGSADQRRAGGDRSRCTRASSARLAPVPAVSTSARAAATVTSPMYPVGVSPARAAAAATSRNSSAVSRTFTLYGQPAPVPDCELASLPAHPEDRQSRRGIRHYRRCMFLFAPQGKSGLHKIIHKVGLDSTKFERTRQLPRPVPEPVCVEGRSKL